MPSFKVACPSCEASVLIKNTDLVGTKIECPKCKYRFKVEEPAGEAAAGGKPAKGDKKDKKDKKPATTEEGGKKKKATGGGKNKKVLALVLAGVGVALLGVGAYVFLGGDPKPTPPPNRPSGIGGTGGGQANNNGPGGEITPVPPKDDTTVAKKPALVRSDKEPTNLLPGKSVAVYRFDLGRMRQTPVGGALLDPALGDLFGKSMGIDPAAVEQYFHCVVGEKERAPFGLIRLKEPVAEKDVTGRVQGIGAAKTVNGKSLHPVAANPFLRAVGNAFAARSLLSDVFDPAAPAAEPAAPAPLGACVFDSQTVLVGDHAALEAFLGELKDGYPEFQTIVKKADPTPPPKPKDGGPATPMGGTTPPPPPAPTTAPPTNKDFTTNPTYLSVPTDLKKLLNALEADTTETPIVLVAERFDAKAYDRANVKRAYESVQKIVAPVLTRTRYVGLNLTRFNTQSVVATVRLIGGTDDDARRIAFDHLSPALLDAAPVVSLLLSAPVEVRNAVRPEQSYPYPLGADGTGTSGTGGPFPSPGATGGAGTYPPTGTPPGTGRPGDPSPSPAGAPVSHIDLRLTDQTVTLGVEMVWTDETYGRVVAPRVFGLVSQLKGKVAVFAGDYTWHGLGRAVAKYVGRTQAFPSGAAVRPPDSARLGMAYPPAQRVSFFAELLPDLGRGGIRQGVNPGLAWYDAQNVTATEAWVPELLVPYYPQAAWRAHSTLAPERTFGGTNYVAVAGVGLDAARYDPANEATKKRLGLCGYDWGSKAADATDGLDKTIYLLQVPPGFSRPWAAGGGATVVGLDPANPMAGFKHKRPDGQEGTYAIMGNGAVRWLPADIDPKVMLALATRAGGEPLPDLDAVAPRVPAPGEPELTADPKPDAKPADPKPAPPKETPKETPKADGPKADAAPAPKEKTESAPAKK